MGGFKYQHLLVGIYFVLTGIMALLSALGNIAGLMSNMNTAFFLYIGFVVVYVIQVVAQIGSGWCMVKKVAFFSVIYLLSQHSRLEQWVPNDPNSPYRMYSCRCFVHYG